MNIEIEDVCLAKPKFRVGDVVTISEASPDKTYVIKESQYHDVSWVYYLNESVRNGLSAWRGKPYNYYQFLTVNHSGDNERIELDTKFMEE